MPEAVTLRRATAEDARRFWAWRNDEATRAASFTSDVIPFEAHVRWFERKLQDPGACLLVAVDAEGRDVGYARLDVTGEAAEISVSLERERRGHGLGAAVIAAAANLAMDHLGVSRVVARVKVDNERSLAAFRRAGFVTVSQGRVAGVEAVEMEVRGVRS